MSEAGPPLDDLDALIRRVDPDRWLSSRYVADPTARADLIALYAYDHEITRAAQVVSEPLLGEIRLAWWREALDEIYQGRPVRRQPTAQALALAVARRALPRALLETPLDARHADLDPAPFADEAALNAWLDAAYGAIMAAAVRMLDPVADPSSVRSVARVWGLSRLPRDRLPAAYDAGRAATGHLAAARAEAKALSPAAFPAVAHLVLRERVGRQRQGFGDRVRLTLAVLTGRF